MQSTNGSSPDTRPRSLRPFRLAVTAACLVAVPACSSGTPNTAGTSTTSTIVTSNTSTSTTAAPTAKTSPQTTSRCHIADDRRTNHRRANDRRFDDHQWERRLHQRLHRRAERCGQPSDRRRRRRWSSPTPHGSEPTPQAPSWSVSSRPPGVENSTQLQLPKPERHTFGPGVPPQRRDPTDLPRGRHPHRAAVGLHRLHPRRRPQPPR